MAVDHLDVLNDEMPDVFQPHAIPQGWDDDWIIVPVSDAEASQYGDDPLDQELLSDSINQVSDNNRMPSLNTGDLFPGSPVLVDTRSEYPPPDALAFYFPFHYYFPEAWGIYITVEGMRYLETMLRRHSGGKITQQDAIVASRMFLYGHEFFHHQIESFAMRLEITHRTPLYKGGFERVYRQYRGTDRCIEEALANAYGYRLVERHMKKNASVLDALQIYIKGNPPGYRRGIDYLKAFKFINARDDFSEANHRESLPSIPGKGQTLWKNFSQAYRGVANIKSRTNYIVHRSSPIASRIGMENRCFRYKDLVRKLEKLCHCKRAGRQRGSHEIWERPDGKRFPVPVHPGDLHRGTLAKIIKQAMTEPMSLSQFMAAAA